MNVSSKPAVSLQNHAIEAGPGAAAMNRQASPALTETIEDDRYPGSFFRVPGVPSPGKTTWSLAK